MNKQELIEAYNRISNFCETVSVNKVIHELEQLDEPERVKIPQFVADWIEEGRKHCEDVSDLFGFDFTNEEVGKWFLQEKPFDLVARAWLDGYTVKKEKRYLVRLKGIAERYCYLNYSFLSEGWFFDDEHTNTNTRAKHTRKELEQAGFEWVFDFPGVEIEEVEE